MQIKRRINHTGRRKIRRSMVRIKLVEQKEKPPAFNASVDLAALYLPPTADIYIEPYYKSSLQRFACGTVTNFTLPADTTLTDVDLGGPVLFRVKVVDNSGHVGRLLASADRIPPVDESDEEDREFLLKVVTRDLGPLPWKVDLLPDIKPELALNNRIPDVLGKIKHDPLFQGLVFPGAVREIYSFILMEDDGGYEEDSWQEKWIRFGENLTGENRPDHDESDGEVREWIGSVVAAFSQQHKLCDRVVDSMSGGSE